ncbi:MAG: YybH family protein [Phycisphaerae bacterium]
MPSRFCQGRPILTLTAFGLVSLLSTGCRTTEKIPATHRQEIRAVIESQEKAWNDGDIEGFMDGYWQSGRLSFNGSGLVVRGWERVLERYKQRYPNRDAMGFLKLDRLEVNELSEDTAYVLGRWFIRGTTHKGGSFTLVMRRIDGDWKIIHDHSSSDPESTE